LWIGSGRDAVRRPLEPIADPDHPGDADADADAARRAEPDDDTA
jgi:hypothetical protein